jgi:hypothetical protein
MSTGDPFTLDPLGLIKAIAARITGDAYWIVKISFHPEMVRLPRRR